MKGELDMTVSTLLSGLIIAVVAAGIELMDRSFEKQEKERFDNL